MPSTLHSPSYTTPLLLIKQGGEIVVTVLLLLLWTPLDTLSALLDEHNAVHYNDDGTSNSFHHFAVTAVGDVTLQYSQKKKMLLITNNLNWICSAKSLFSWSLTVHEIFFSSPRLFLLFRVFSISVPQTGPSLNGRFGYALMVESKLKALTFGQQMLPLSLGATPACLYF
jgi:hypothetical protein